jgi:hypothetical protein
MRYADSDPFKSSLLEGIRSMTRGEIQAIIKEVPPNRMSDVATLFTLELIMANQVRLLKL